MRVADALVHDAVLLGRRDRVNVPPRTADA